MIQEKDFLYRVPVKTAPITTPGGQIRNPEILVDVEGGEFMHGNILDANSTNKLVNQSIKEAVDNKIIEGGYVTKDLLEAETTRATEQENSLKTLIGAETSARTKGDEDLSSKIKAEQTRAEGKEKEISDKLAIVNGDSNTEGSFRKAIADVVAGNDDLHTALNQAIATKADASALANEVARATGVERGLQAAIDTKVDASALGNYVLTTALNKQIDTLNTAISAKQDKGNYITANVVQDTYFGLKKGLKIYNEAANKIMTISHNGIELEANETAISINPSGVFVDSTSDGTLLYSFTLLGIRFAGKTENDIPTANGSFIDISNYATRDFVTAGLSAKQNKITVDTVDITDIETADVTKLRTIVTNLIKALSSSGLINTTEGIE